MPAPRIHVVAGVLFNPSGRVLVARRPSGAHLAGRWEFPGGKLMPRESREAGLARELAEELGIRVLIARPLIWVEHRYPDRDVVLDVWKVESFTNEPHGREGQQIEWRDIHRLDPARFPPADFPVLAALRLPSRYLVTPEPGEDWDGFLGRLEARVAEGFDLIQLRAKRLDESSLVALGRRAAHICLRGGAKLLVNAGPAIARRCGADGFHLTSRRLADMAHLPSVADAVPHAGPEHAPGGPYPSLPPGLDAFAATAREMREGSAAAQEQRLSPIGASCHDAPDLERARAAGCDFAVLGPVRVTPTHPGATVLDWNGFEALARGAGLPVFAIGGLGDDDVATVQRNGGQGVAAIRAFWGEQ